MLIEWAERNPKVIADTMEFYKRLINDEIWSYGRCIKMLWNEYFRPLPDGEHDFAAVQKLLWETLVVKFLQDTEADIAQGEIVVVARHAIETILVGRASESEHAVCWQEESRSLAGQLLNFEGFFDFRSWQDPRELKFVRCRSSDSPTEFLLLKSNEVDFYYRSQRPS